MRLFMIAISFLFFLSTASAGKISLLIELPDGTQIYRKNIVAYSGPGTVIFQGNLSRQQLSALGALKIENGSLVIDQVKLQELNDAKAAAAAAKLARRNSRASLLVPNTNINDARVKKLLIKMLKEWADENDEDPDA